VINNKLDQLLDTRPWLLADGAMGSNLFDVGLISGEAPELWNFSHPDQIVKLHQDFVDAGADIILTNSFGGTEYRLKLHNAQNRVYDINYQATRLARQVADCFKQRTILVAGSIGPTGEILSPVGSLSHEEAIQAFSKQAKGLLDGGADLLWIETMSSREEVEAAIAGAATAGIPIVCTLSFDTNGRTMMGLSAQDMSDIAFKAKLNYPLTAYGSNCGVGASEVVACIHNLAQADKTKLTLVAKGNCGIPEYIDGHICYNGTPELMASYACMSYDAGARIIGGCCGTSPVHLRAMYDALIKHEKSNTSITLESIVEKLGEVSNGAKAQWEGQNSRSAGAAPGANIRKRPNRRRSN
jgi:5-methyltetrahydrofolate--homocysteine methyltransferase